MTDFKKALEALNLTIKEAAELLDRPYWTVVKWSNGDRVCHPRVIEDLKLRFKAEKK